MVQCEPHSTAVSCRVHQSQQGPGVRQMSYCQLSMIHKPHPPPELTNSCQNMRSTIFSVCFSWSSITDISCNRGRRLMLELTKHGLEPTVQWLWLWESCWIPCWKHISCLNTDASKNNEWNQFRSIPWMSAFILSGSGAYFCLHTTPTKSCAYACAMRC